MKLIECGHCGRPFYDKEKACPYCGHAFDSLPPVEKENEELEDTRPLSSTTPSNLDRETKNGELKTESNIDAPASSPLTTLHSPFTLRAESIAAITENQSQPDIPNHQPCNDPNQIETTYPPHKRRVWLWVVIILIVLALAAAAVIVITNSKSY